MTMHPPEPRIVHFILFGLLQDEKPFLLLTDSKQGRLYIQGYRKLDYKFGFSHLWKKDGLNGSHLPTRRSNAGEGSVFLNIL